MPQMDGRRFMKDSANLACKESELPVGPVRWKYLKLTKDGHWLPDVAKMQASLPNLQTGDGDPILKKVAQFNDCMRACRRMLGKPCFAMGRSHLDACQEA